MRIGLTLAAAVTALVTATQAPASTFYVTTGNAGGEFSIDAGDMRAWNIVPTIAETHFGGAIFMMRRGAGVTVGLTLALYDDANSLLAWVGFPDSSFVGETFTQVNFALASALVVNPGDTYSVRLMADAGTPLGGDDQYFFKGETSTLTLDTTPLDEINLGGVATPEPASALLLVAGLLGLGIAHRRGTGTAAVAA